MFKHLPTLLLALALTGLAHAAPPTTLGYQGRLATEGGQPITASLGITFRLYDVATGGTALWSEAQTGVAVDGGNLAVELGKITPLPASIWGRQLYLGMQIAGDSEMLPRPPLTAAPFAQRAASVMTNTIHLSDEGSPTDNGTALLAAAARAATLTFATIELDAGIFDLGGSILEIPPGTTLSGRSRNSTVITSAHPVGTVRLASGAAARDFTAKATGIPPSNVDAVSAVLADTPAHDGTPVTFVRIERVHAQIVAGSDPISGRGGHNGFFVCASSSHVDDVSAAVTGGQFAIGFRADCPAGINNVFEQVETTTVFSFDGARGAYLAGGASVWRDFKVTVQPAQSTVSSFGIRIFAATDSRTSLLTGANVEVNGGNPPTAPNFSQVIDAVRIDNAGVDIERLRANVHDTRVTYASGLRILSIAGDPVVHADDLNLTVNGVQAPSGGFAAIDGITALNAAPRISRAKIDVRCNAGATYRCTGATRDSQSALGALQAGVVLLDHVDVTVAQVNAADASAFTNGYAGVGQARITGSTLVVQRSPFGEPHSVALANTGDSLTVLDSTLLVEGPPAATGTCAIGGGGTIVLAGSTVAGGSCTFGPAPVCNGNTKLGTGFLASSCP